MRPSWASASWARTASDWDMKASTGWGGRPRTKSSRAVTNSGFSAYISGVKHHGKMPWITVSATLPRARAMTCELLTTAATRVRSSPTRCAVTTKPTEVTRTIGGAGRPRFAVAGWRPDDGSLAVRYTHSAALTT